MSDTDDLSLMDTDHGGPYAAPAALGGAAGDATEGAPPFLNRRLSVAEWRAYVAAYVWPTVRPSRLVLHHTYKPDAADWRGLASMRAMQRFYAGKGWPAAPHLYAAPDGIWLATPMDRPGIHAGTGNCNVGYQQPVWGGRPLAWYSIGLEMVGFFDRARPGGAVWQHALAVMAELSRVLGIAPAPLLAFHRDYTNVKSCPGWAVTRDWVLSELRAALAATSPYRTLRATAVREAPRADASIAWGGTATLPAGQTLDLAPTADVAWLHWAAAGFVAASDVAPLTAPGYTADSPLLADVALSPADAAALADAVFLRCQRAGSPYAAEPADPIRGVIVPATIRLCARGGVDPYLALAQLGHESGWLKAALSQRTDKDGRPLRNGYGIGVNEARDRATPHHRPGTVFDADAGGYRPAVGFARWEDAVLAQVGRLIAYALAPADRTPAQADLVTQALAFRDLPVSFHGSAPTLKALGKAHNPLGAAGAGWASPGTDYGARLAEKAAGLRGRQGGDGR